ncbi:MAG: hypothetical protein ACE5HO_04275 [bacterium]
MRLNHSNMSDLEPTFFGERLSPSLEAFLRETNPWWESQPMRPLPPLRRWLFEPTLQKLKAGLAPVTVLRGPLQVGKTTLQEQIIDHLLHSEKIDPHRDTLGLRAFVEKAVYNAPFGLLITLTDDVEVADPRIEALPLSSVLLMR